MKWLLLIIFPVIVIGCSPASMWTEYKKDTKVKKEEQSASKATAEGKFQITYPEPTPITLTTSGNSTATVSLGGQKGMVHAHNEEKRTAADESSSKFSFDELIESTPTWLKLLILIAIIFLIKVYRNFVKNTMAGRALDAGLSMGIGVLSKGISGISKKLEHMDPKDPEFNALRETRDEMEKEQADLKEKTRGNGA